MTIAGGSQPIEARPNERTADAALPSGGCDDERAQERDGRTTRGEDDMPDERGFDDRNQREHVGGVPHQGSHERKEIFARKRIGIQPFDPSEVTRYAFTDECVVHRRHRRVLYVAGQPLAAMTDALAQTRSWWDAAQVRRVWPDNAAVDIFHRWMAEHSLGRRRILDTLLAATYRGAGITAIVSSNARDYRLFFKTVLAP